MLDPATESAMRARFAAADFSRWMGLELIAESGRGQMLSSELKALSGWPTPISPGVYAVPRDWNSAGVWIVNLVGTCAGKTAGAIVAIGPRDNFRRAR